MLHWPFLFHSSTYLFLYPGYIFFFLSEKKKKTWIRTFQKSEEGFSICRKNKKTVKKG